MYTGQIKRNLIARRIAVALWTLAALGLMAGCGGKDEAEPVAQEEPQAMVPATEDSNAINTAADTVLTAGTAVTEAGTSGTDGVIQALDSEKNPYQGSESAGTQSGESSVDSPFNRPQVTTGNGAFSLQLGSFRNVDNAHAQVARIRELGYSPTVEVASLGGQTYHRVVLRGLADRSEAERFGEHVRSELGITYLIRQK